MKGVVDEVKFKPRHSVAPERNSDLQSANIAHVIQSLSAAAHVYFNVLFDLFIFCHQTFITSLRRLSNLSPIPARARPK